METANLDIVLHVRVAQTLDRAIRTEARRLRVKPSCVIRAALMRGLYTPGDDGNGGGRQMEESHGDSGS